MNLLKRFIYVFTFNLTLFFILMLGIQNSNVKNKVNFDSIETKNYQATEEDLRYFENLFETKILEKNIKDILKLKKIRQFVLEIS